MMTRINPENTQAILIGASQFDFGSEAGFQNLPGVNTNLSKFNLLLIEVVGIGKDRIHPMLDRDNSNAITSEISEIIDIVPKASDTMIVYYAGHGITRQKKLYLATKKTRFNKPQRTGAIESNDLVSLVIEETKAKNIIFIIDCCFSAIAKEGVDSRGKNIFFITAAPSTQTAKDEAPEDTNYTAFTHELLVILKNGIENASEFLTLQDISNQLIKQLKAQNLPEPQLSSNGQPDKLEICKNLDDQHDATNVQVLPPIQSAKYTHQISEITEYVENFFLFAQQDKYQDALGNGRKLAEAVSKIVLFKKKGQLNKVVIYQSDRSSVEIQIDGANYKFAINKNLETPDFRPLMLEDLIQEIKGFIPKDTVKSIRELQQQGNPASHSSGGHHQFTEATFLICKPQIESLVNWLFKIFFKTQLPNEIQDAFNNPLKKLKTFQPVASIIKAKGTQPLFENDLLYFTPTEAHKMQQIGEQLAHQHQVLLLGDPATGKSMMAFALANQLQEKGYQAYYCSLASSDKALKDDIDALLYRKVLFIIDDCHLDIDIATELCLKFHHLTNVSVALLFISRNISKKLQQSVQFEWFNLFEELKAVTFQTESHDLETKVRGIIAKYQAYYQHQQSDCQYVVGDEAVIMGNFRKSLVMLSYYLDLWKEKPVLSEISEKQVLEMVYAKYFRKLALNQQDIACLLQYACLYVFEVEFESLPDKEETTEGLAKKGIIVEARKHIYAFYHSDFADLLLRAYEAYEESRFQRKYKTVDNFLWVQIKSYLLSFVVDYGYPDNVHTILRNIAGSQKAFLLGKLVADDDLKKLIVGFYAEKTDRVTLLQFVGVLSKNMPTLFNEYFENLFDKNEYFKEVFLLAKNSFSIYVDILENLRKNEIAYNTFLGNWEEQEPALIENTGIRFIGFDLRRLQLHISQDKAKQLYNFFDNAFFILKIQEANLASISRALNELNQVNPSKTAAIFAQVNNAFFILKIQEANLVDIGNALIELNQVNPGKTVAIFEQIDNEFFIPKIQEANLTGIGENLNRLNVIDNNKTAAILAQVDKAFFISKIQEANLQGIGNALSNLNQVDSSKTAALFEQVDNEFFIPKIQEANLANIGIALNELNQVNPSKIAAILAQVDNAFFIPKIQEANLANIGEALNTLNQVNPSKTVAIFEQVDNAFFTPKIKEANLQGIGKALNELNQVNPSKTKAIFAQVDNAFLISQIKKANLTQIGHALIELNQVNPSKTKAIFEQIDNAFFTPKIHEANLVDIGNALIGLSLVNLSKTKAIFEQIDNAFFTPKIHEANLANIGGALNELNQVNSSKTKAIFEQVDNAFFISKIQEANLQGIGNALSNLNKVDSSKTAALFEQVDNAFFIPKIQEANLTGIGENLNRLNAINPNKTAAIFENIDDNLLVQKATRLNFVSLANALIHLNKVSDNKTQHIFKALQSIFTVSKLTKEIETVKYETFLYRISIFLKLDAGFGKLLLQNIDESYLFQWNKLKNIKQFNQLLNAFRLAEISKEDENVKQLISFAQKHKDKFLSRRKISDVGSFLQQLANYIDIQPIIEQNVGKFVGKIRSEKDQTKIPRFIGIIHANAPDKAFYLFKQFKKSYPDAQEIIGFTHYYIGKNYREQLQHQKASHHLEIAKAIFTELNHEIGFELVQTELEQLKIVAN